MSLLCAVLLFQAFRRSKYPLLIWGAICFSGLALNNIVLFSDRIIFPEYDLSTLRLGIALVSVLVLLCGLIFDSE